jgi:hypothetical protein
MGSSRQSAKAWIELNYFEYSDSKRFYLEPDVVKYNMERKP